MSKIVSEYDEEIPQSQTKKVELATHGLHYMYHGFTGFHRPVSFYASNPASTHQLYLYVMVMCRPTR